MAVFTGLGSAAAPSITFSADTNTGIYNYGADQLAISTGGTARLFVDASGSVGVGTVSGGERLFVDGNIGLSFSNSLIWMPFDNSYRSGIRFNTSGRELSLFSTTNDSGGIITFYTRNAAGSSATDYGTERMRITSAGFVGIGTSTPGTTLEVYPIGAASGGSSPSLTGTGGSFAITHSNLVTSLEFGGYASAPYGLWLQTKNKIGQSFPLVLNPLGGNVGIGVDPTQALDVNGAIKAASNGGGVSYFLPGNTAIRDTGVGTTLYIDLASASATHGQFVIRSSNTFTERFVINASGHVGILSASPTVALDVDSNTVRVRTARTPASAAATGAVGEICWDTSYIYVCTATNTWKRVAIATW